MNKLLKYDESLYHAPNAPHLHMVPITSWVKPCGNVQLFRGGSGVVGAGDAAELALFRDALAASGIQ